MRVPSEVVVSDLTAGLLRQAQHVCSACLSINAARKVQPCRKVSVERTTIDGRVGSSSPDTS
jgi:hypothetical protein